MSYAPFVSIDLETTGLDPRTCQILEVGLVVDDWSTPIDKLPSCSFYVDPGAIHGEPYALQMNAEIIEQIIAMRGSWAERDGLLIKTTDVAARIQNWLLQTLPLIGDRANPWREGKVFFRPAGKNYAGFDKAFLELLPNWHDLMAPHHRAIDPGSMYFDPRIDDDVPGTEECLRRAGLDPDVKHRAEEDARDVVRLIRRKAAAQAMADMQSRRATHE